MMGFFKGEVVIRAVREQHPGLAASVPLKITRVTVLNWGDDGSPQQLRAEGEAAGEEFMRQIRWDEPPPPLVPASEHDRLACLAALREKGAITEEEYAELRRKIVDET